MAYAMCLRCGGGFPDGCQTCTHCGTPAGDGHDPVTSPAHYRQGTIEVIEAIEGLALGYREGNVLKYLARYRYKNGVEDLRKAAWYLQRLIQEVEAG
jgi:hypothetical protein